MSQILLLKGNPSKRRRSGKRRSPAQRAATARMLAANRGRRNPSKRRKSHAVSAAPVKHRRRRGAKRSARRISRRSSGMGGGSSNMMNLLKTGAIMGGGAVVADVGMGLIAKFMPTTAGSSLNLTTRVNADGSVNYMYYATKGALAWAMAKYGSRITRHAPAMAAGALAVMAHDLMLTFMPTDGSIPLAGVGFFNPGRITQGGSLGRIMRNPSGIPLANTATMQGLNKIINLPAMQGKGAIAAATVRNLSGNSRR